MLWWKLLGILLIPLQLIIMLYRDWKYHDRRTNNYKTLTRIQICIVVFAMLIFGITIYFDSGTEKELRDVITELRDQVSDLNTSLVPLQRIAENTQETYFVLSDKKERKMEDGSYAVSFTLKPVGKKIIPLFKIQCRTFNGAKIKEIKVEGRNLPGMSYDRKSNDMTYFSREFRAIEPGQIFLTIITDTIPVGMKIAVDPFKKESNAG